MSSREKEGRGMFPAIREKVSEVNDMTWEQLRTPGIVVGSIASVIGVVISWEWMVVAGLTIIAVLGIQAMTERQTKRVTRLSEEGHLDERTEDYLGIPRRSSVDYGDDAFSDSEN